MQVCVYVDVLKGAFVFITCPSQVFTCRERQECIFPDKIAIFVEKALRVEDAWFLPLGLIHQNRVKYWHHCGSLDTKDDCKENSLMKSSVKVQTIERASVKV